MKKVLVVQSSVSAENGKSNQLMQQFIDALPSGFAREELDLVSLALPHLTMTEISAWMTPAEARNAEQAELAGLSERAIAQVQAADVILLGVPMYNFGGAKPVKSLVRSAGACRHHL